VYAAAAARPLLETRSLHSSAAVSTKVEEASQRRRGFFEWLFGTRAAPEPANVGTTTEAASVSSGPRSCRHVDGSLPETGTDPLKELSYSIRRTAYAAASRHPHCRVQDTTTGRGFFEWLFGGANVSESASIESFNEESEDENELGYRLEDLQEVGILGHGSFGAVFLARDCSTSGPSLALKVISKSLLAERELQHTAVNERRVLRRSSSPFLVQLQAAFETSQFCYFLLEAALGGNLCTIYEFCNFFGSEVHAQFYMACMLNAFEHLHERGWMYRDLKTENVVLDARGYGKLCDFGTAKLLSGLDCQLTHTVCGTLEYMAPEIFIGRGYSFPADWWALGIFVYELLVGETPFGAEDNAEVFAKMRKGIEKVCFPATKRPWHDLVRSLCKWEPTERMPMLEGGTANVREQAWYAETAFDWDALRECRMVPPHVPDIRGPEDLSNFSEAEQYLGNLLEGAVFRAGLPTSPTRREGRSWSTCLL